VVCALAGGAWLPARSACEQAFGMSSTISLSPEAFGVLFMHACKHPHRTINGLLLGSAADSAVSVSEALPLFHSSLALAPMLEAALLLADEYCQQKKVQIVGYYQANEIVEDTDLGAFGKKIAEKVRGQCATCAVLMLDGQKMHPTPTDLRLLALGADGKRNGTTPTIAPDAAAGIAKLDACLKRGVQHDLVDFDTHLDDCTKDWTGNAALLAS